MLEKVRDPHLQILECMALSPSSAGPISTLTTLLRSTLQLGREQWLSPEELAARRLGRVKKILARAAETRYYGEVLRQAGITDPSRFDLPDLRVLPFLDRRVTAHQGLDAGEGDEALLTAEAL